jgi:hypothetical protein
VFRELHAYNWTDFEALRGRRIPPLHLRVLKLGCPSFASTNWRTWPSWTVLLFVFDYRSPNELNEKEPCGNGVALGLFLRHPFMTPMLIHTQASLKRSHLFLSRSCRSHTTALSSIKCTSVHYVIISDKFAGIYVCFLQHYGKLA